ncbi:hypothetical protein NQ317_001104 [Molorchus minor]|uniref:DNA-directed DNA polymerase n=1 Tax=Molorchus minor TaxID=1323400 RepID=A0ABQ9IW15_9CUCU|nr:hypothetical protein NQ317_001104 [Molorchus minor]
MKVRLLKLKDLENQEYEVLEMWECRESHPLVTLSPLNPRYAFYGGRTGNTVEYYKCRPGEKIKYVDVCSLYPWACRYGKSPLATLKCIWGSLPQRHYWCRRGNQVQHSST